METKLTTTENIKEINKKKKKKPLVDEGPSQQSGVVPG